MKRVWSILGAGVTLVFSFCLAHAAEFYVSPTGTPGGNGSQANPWDIQTAFAHPPAVKPGDTIWLRGGTYNITGTLNANLTGTAAAPIKVRQYPGERATLDTGASSSNRIAIYGGYTWYMGFEVMSSGSNRWDSNSRGQGIDIYGSTGIKLINLIYHDTLSAIGCWSPAINAEIYGCLIYYNGYDFTDRGHGHAIYTQNDAANNSTKWLRDNIMFAQYSHGVHAYTQGGRIDNFVLEGNISFDQGIISTISGGTRDLLIGGTPIALNPVARENYTYYRPTVTGTGCDFGYGAGVSNCTVLNNYFVGRSTAFNLKENATATITGNTFYGDTPGCSPATYPANTYHGLTRPTGVRIFVRPNVYEPGRAHIAVFNWDNLDAVNADVSGVLSAGDIYEVRDAQNYFGPPVATGTYGGGTITIPMNLTAVAPVIGTPCRPFTHTPKEFGAFVLQKTGVAPNQPPVANAGPDQVVTDVDGNGSETVALDGAGSYDPDGTIVSYVWKEGETQIATGVNPTVTFALGTHIVTLVVTDNRGATGTDTVTITVNPPTQEPYGGVPWPIPGRIQAEDYDLGGEGVAYHDTTPGNEGSAYRTDDVDICATSDVGGGYLVKSIVAGEWLEYTVFVAATGPYDIKLRAATPNNGRYLHIEFDGVDVTGPIVLPNTGDWDVSATVVVPRVTLAAGLHIMRIVMDTGDFNLNWIEVTTSDAFDLSLSPGWNLVSIPIAPLQPQVQAVFPPAAVSAVWEYEPASGYTQPTQIQPKRGYWVFANALTVLRIDGFRPSDTTVPVVGGWNLIGIVGTSASQPWQPLPPSPPCTALWEYLPPYRVPRVRCGEGRGYWVQMSGRGTLFPTNLAPVVDAGPDQTITLPAAAILDATVTDDGLPNPPGAVTTIWTKVSGPGTVTFANPAAVDTTATFSLPGAYILRLTASDGALSASDDATITVNSAGSVYISFEAESGTLAAPMTTATHAQASGGLYVTTPTANQGTVTFNLDIPVAGTYIIWCRVLAPDGSSDSFFVSMDGGPEDIYDVAEGTWSPNWQWTRVNGRAGGPPLTLNPRTFDLTAGLHTLVFRGREANSRLDRLIVTNDITFMPTD